MKNLCSFISRNIQVTSCLMVACIILASCHKEAIENTDYPEIVKNTQIRPEFEKFPPIAENIEVEVLQRPLNTGENIRVVANFENSKLGLEFLALHLGDTKIALRDDGKGADLKAKDGRFSIFIKQNIDSLSDELNRRRELILSKRAPSFTFEHRMAVPINLDRIKKFDIDRFENDRIFEIPKDILIPNLPVMIRHEKSLTITAPSVITDPERTFNPCTEVGNPNGVWTFGSLMRQMASASPTSIATDAEVSDFVLNWLEIWLTSVLVNESGVASRTLMKQYVIDPWLFRSQMAGAPLGQLKMEFAPFRLAAIVNRLDLRGNSGYGFSNAGEGRFIFSLISSGGCWGDTFPDGPFEGPDGAFNVILEYGINKKSCTAVKAYAQEWADLSTMIPGTVAYNNALEHITNQFTQCGTNTSKPNQSSLNQVRTNENGLVLPWELREFNLAESGELIIVPVKMEPRYTFNGHSDPISNTDVERFAAYVNANSANIANNNYEVPEKLSVTQGVPTPVMPFLAGSSINENLSGGINHWDGSSTAGPAFINDNEARHMFSLNTCSGCHGRETNTTSFVHLSSGFLTGITVSDAANRPTGSPVSRTFNDLGRREMDLANLINGACSKLDFLQLSEMLTFRPINMVH